MRRMLLAFLAVAVYLIASPLAAQSESPQAVSPGSVAVSEPLGTSCPTFSWSGVPGAEGYELVIYRVAESGELEAELEVTAPRGATSWTPSAAQCPSSEARYAWAVRAIQREGTGAWSEALLFETAGAPSKDEVRRALRVLRRYTEMAGSREAAASGDDVVQVEQDLEEFREHKLRPGLQAIRRELNRETQVSDAATTVPSPQTVTPPASFSLTIDGDFDLGGYIFKDGVPFIHNDGGGHPYNNTAVGLHALSSLTLGSPGPYDGRKNSAFGHRALQDNTSGNSNSAVGFRSLYSNTTGLANTATGYSSLKNNTAGDFNSAFGANALYHSTGSQNTAIGYAAGANWTAGSFNIALGTGSDGVSGETRTIRIGGEDQQLRTFIEGIRGASSDDATYGFDQAVCTDQYEQLGPCAPSTLRLKEAVRTMDDTATLVSALRPVTFRFKPREGQEAEPPLQYGLIAEEVAKVLPTLVSYDDQGKPFTVRYSLLTPLLLNELQRQQAVLRKQQAELEELRAVDDEVADLRQRLDKLAKKKRFR